MAAGLADVDAGVRSGDRHGASAVDLSATVGGDNRGHSSLLNLNVGLGGGVGHR